MARSASGWLAGGLISGGTGLVLGLLGFGWAAFFSLGFKGGSTDELIKYNLSDPLTAGIAYGPLALGVLALLLGVVLMVVWAVKRRG